jgi:hypothetical protein
LITEITNTEEAEINRNSEVNCLKKLVACPNPKDKNKKENN